MQVPLVLAGSVRGVLERLVARHSLWLLGALVLFANWPYTFVSIMPTNRQLLGGGRRSGGASGAPGLNGGAARTLGGPCSVS